MASHPKIYLTNHSMSETMEFPVATGGLMAIKAGETAHFAIANPDSPQIRGFAHAGLIEISDKAPEKPDPASASVSSGPTPPPASSKGS